MAARSSVNECDQQFTGEPNGADSLSAQCSKGWGKLEWFSPAESDDALQLRITNTEETCQAVHIMQMQGEFELMLGNIHIAESDDMMVDLSAFRGIQTNEWILLRIRPESTE